MRAGRPGADMKPGESLPEPDLKSITDDEWLAGVRYGTL